jgi:DNA-directed RNA polymerase subunit RPC12/RpoP/G:T-mismatch repair DNA endonuclease (very short patch repair protein)
MEVKTTWTCKYCGSKTIYKNKFTVSGHTSQCVKWYQYRDYNLSKDNLERLYIKENKSLPDIAKLYSVSTSAVYNQLKRFNIKSRSIKESNVESAIKAAKTNLKRYGFENVLNKNCIIRIEMEKEHLHQFGVVNFGQFQHVKDKIKSSNLERWGVEYPTKSPIVQQKIRETLFRNHSVDYPYKLVNKRNKISIPHQKIISIYQNSSFNYEIEKALLFDNKLYFYDLWIEEANLLIEVNGDYYHLNPVKYKADYFNTCTRVLAQDKWNYDALKLQRANNAGHNVLTIWENDIKSLLSLEVVRSKILNITKFLVENKHIIPPTIY